MLIEAPRWLQLRVRTCLGLSNGALTVWRHGRITVLLTDIIATLNLSLSSTIVCYLQVVKMQLPSYITQALMSASTRTNTYTPPT
jgi:hypothetical protein